MAHVQAITMLAGQATRPHRRYDHVLELLCWDFDGFDRCDRAIAWLVEVSFTPREWALWTGRSPDEQPADERRMRVLAVREGDYPGCDGVYREIKDAAKSLRYGHAPSYRRPIVPDPSADSDPSFIRNLWAGTWEVAPLPYTVQCSKCPTVHTLHADELGLKGRKL